MSTDPPKRRRRRGRRRRKPSDPSPARTEATPTVDPAEDQAKARRKGRRRGNARGRSRSRGGRGKRKGSARRQGTGHRRWWTKRWSESLDVIQVGRRLGHGRSYARQGRVEDLELDGGSVTARVQGSLKAPYLVRMLFGQLKASDWRPLLRQLGEEGDVGGSLVRGEFPPEVEAAFARMGVSLFPSGPGDLRADCSCPDPANPCKHVAAVFYALGSEIDRDPFVLLRLRGLERAALLEGLEGTPAARAAEVAPPSAEEVARRKDKLARREEREAAAEAAETEPDPATPQPLPDDPQIFWAGVGAGNGASRVSHEDVRVPATPGALIKRLGGLTFWGGEVGYQVTLDRLYDGASAAGLHHYIGDRYPGADGDS